MILSSENYNGNYFTINVPNLIENPFDDYIIKSLKRPVISYGAEDIDNESIFFTSNVRVEFRCNNASLFPVLYDPSVSITVFENNSFVFTGNIDVEDINYTRINKTFKLTFTDASKTLKTKPYTLLPSYIGNNTITFVQDIISVILNTIDYTLEVRGADSLKLKTNATFLGVPFYANFTQFGTYPSYFFDGTYKTLWDALKGILDSFGLLGYFAGNKFILQPRFYSDIIILTDADISEKTEQSIIGGYDYVECSIRVGTVGQRVIYNYDHRINTTEDPKKKITYYFEVPGGSHPIYNSQTSFNNLYGYVPEYVAGIGNAYWSNLPDSISINGGSEYACWKAVSLTIDNIIKNNRLKIKTDIFKIPISLFDTIQIDGRNYKIITTKREIGIAKTSIMGLG